jgi:DUF4097 and DUF4098 domain-containing protein YvlB
MAGQHPPIVPPSLPPGSPPPGSPPLPPGPPQPPRPAGAPTRARRRRSIFPGLLLIVVGVLLLAARLHPDIRLGYLITHFWPVIIILWGIAKLIDRFATPQGAVHPAMLTGGEFALIIIMLALVGAVAFGTWIHGRLPRGALDIAPFLEHASASRRVDVKIVEPDSTFAVSTRDGALVIHAAENNSLLVLGTVSAGASSQDAAQNRVKNVDVVFDGASGNYQIHPTNQTGDVSADLDVQLPKSSKVIARSQKGDVSVSGMQGGADVATRNGDIQIHDVGASAIADLQNGDAHLRNISGPVTFTGHGGGDLQITDVQGDVNIGGNVFGDVDIHSVSRAVHFASPRATVQIAALPGELKIDNSDIVLSGAGGPVSVNARNQDVKIGNVDGQLTLTDNRGDIDVTFDSSPKAAVNITNDAGDVDVTLPANSNFTLFASSKSGDVTNDFAPHSDDDDSKSVTATYGSGGPVIHITTNYGDIHIGKASQ